MKKVIIIILTIIFASITSFFANRKLSISKNNNDLMVISVNGKQFTSTGALPLNNNQLLINREMINLLDVGIVEESTFRILTPGNGSIVVGLYEPYENSRANFMLWLQENGYSHVDVDQLIIQNK